MCRGEEEGIKAAVGKEEVFLSFVDPVPLLKAEKRHKLAREYSAAAINTYIYICDEMHTTSVLTHVIRAFVDSSFASEGRKKLEAG